MKFRKLIVAIIRNYIILLNITVIFSTGSVFELFLLFLPFLLPIPNRKLLSDFKMGPILQFIDSIKNFWSKDYTIFL